MIGGCRFSTSSYRGTNMMKGLERYPMIRKFVPSAVTLGHRRVGHVQKLRSHLGTCKPIFAGFQEETACPDRQIRQDPTPEGFPSFADQNLCSQSGGARRNCSRE